MAVTTPLAVQSMSSSGLKGRVVVFVVVLVVELVLEFEGELEFEGILEFELELFELELGLGLGLGLGVGFELELELANVRVVIYAGFAFGSSFLLFLLPNLLEFGLIKLFPNTLSYPSSLIFKDFCNSFL